MQRPILILYIIHVSIPRSGILGLDGNSMFKISRNCQTVFQSDYTINLWAFIILFLLFNIFLVSLGLLWHETTTCSNVQTKD